MIGGNRTSLCVCVMYVVRKVAHKRKRKKEIQGGEDRCFQGKTFTSHRTLVTDH